jgi:shikimate 5-dehydrogenase/shikimate kinase
MVTEHEPKNGRLFSRDASVVLIGLRGSGKRSLGFIASTELKWRFVTEDHCFEELTGQTRAEYLIQHGSEAFRRKGIEVIKAMLQRYKFKCVIECGFGSLAVEVQTCLREFCKTNPVIHIVRDMQDIRQLLRLTDTQALLMERGDASHRACSNFEYYNLYDSNSEIFGENGSVDRHSPNYSFKLKAAKQDFCSFVRSLAGPPLLPAPSGPFALSAMPVEFRAYTHTVTIKLSELLNADFDFEELESSEDAVEYKVDVFSETYLAAISSHIASIRRKVGVPVIYDIDAEALSKVSSPRHERSITNDIIFGLMLHGLRLRVDFLVVDIDSVDDRLEELIKIKGPTKVIGNFFDPKPVSGAWRTQERLAKLEMAELLGVDVVRLVQPVVSPMDNSHVREFSRQVRARPGKLIPLIAYNCGLDGRQSIVTNSVLTPVQRQSSHCQPSDGSLEQPRSQITAAQAMRELFDRKILDPLTFYVIGAGLGHSLAPAMHTAAYDTCGLQYNKQVLETSSEHDIWAVARKDNFGGASISRPFKVSICAKLAAKSHHAEAIGAINTLIPLRSAQDGNTISLDPQKIQRARAGPILGWFGDNTDWIGITTCIIRNLSPINVIQSLKTTALVIGAGGVARAAVYALIRLGCRKVFIYNRTRAKADQVAAHFNSWLTKRSIRIQEVDVIASPNDSWPGNFHPPTIVVSCIPAYGYSHNDNTGIPFQWLSSPTGGLILEVRGSGTQYASSS